MLLRLYKEPPPFFRALNVKIKFLYFSFLLGLVLLSNKISFLLLVLLFHLFILFLSKLSPKDLIKAYLEPLSIALLILFLKSFSFSSLTFNLYFFQKTLPIALKILSAFSLFLIFYYTTTFFEILRLLQWLRVPPLLKELIFLSFQTLVIIHDKVFLTYLSQKIRLGYDNFKNSMRSISYLIQCIFLNSLNSTENLFQSLRQRGFDFNNFPFFASSLSKKELLGCLFLLIFWSLLWKIL